MRRVPRPEVTPVRNHITVPVLERDVPPLPLPRGDFHHHPTCGHVHHPAALHTRAAPMGPPTMMPNTIHDSHPEAASAVTGSSS
jgi:hypothetical protein